MKTLFFVLIAVIATLTGCDKKAEPVVVVPQAQEAAPAPAAPQAQILIPADRPMPKPRRKDPSHF